MAEIAKIHGNDIRDKKIVDAQVSTTPSDVTSNSVIPVEAEDGTIIKLKRDSLVQAFASVLNSNSQSTITTLFGADANGNHANINMSNLASVLSAATLSTSAPDSMLQPGVWSYSGDLYLVWDCASSYGTLTTQMSFSLDPITPKISNVKTRVYSRYNNSWSAWLFLS